jgi:Amt family ammonium transporter
MTPALAFFYAGLVRSKNALNTMMMSFISLGVVGIVWALLGYSLAFGTGNAVIGDFSSVFGWLGKMGALDFAGGTVVHVNAAGAALVAAVVVGRRKDFGRRAFLPHNVPFTLLGAGVLWFGWFGFNAGSALAANKSAVLAFVTTFLAPMATIVTWALLDLKTNKKVTAVGTATALVVGLVAITPAAGFISPLAAIALGAISAVPSYYALLFRARQRLDDSLDVIAAHGVGGTVGALLTGVFARKVWNGTTDGLLAGHPTQLFIQLAAVVAVLAYTCVGTYVILKVLSKVMKLRADSSEENVGLDLSEHGEQAESEGEGAILVPVEGAAV